MELLIFTIAALLLIFYFGFVNQSKKRRRLPPGPRNLPVFGSLLSLGAEPYKTFQSWAKIYGPIVYTKFGFIEVVIIDDPKLLKHTFSDVDFSGQMDNINFALITGGSPGLTGADPPGVFEQRRVTIRHMRDFGMGKQAIESLILNEFNEVAEWIKVNEGHPISLLERFVVAAGNPALVLLAGIRFPHDDAHFNKLIKDANRAVFDVTKSNSLMTYFPYMHTILPNIFRKNWYNSVKLIAPFRQLFADLVQSHTSKSESAKYNDNDVLSGLLTTAKQIKDPNSLFASTQSVKTITSIIIQLYGMAQATISDTLSWTVLLLARFPNVQIKVQQELDEVIGQKQQATIGDRSRLTYVQAVITEILRYTSLSPIGGLHKTMQDTRLGGYHIRKGTTVIGNLYSIHHNIQTWGDPHNFRPERFLSPDGKTLVDTSNVMAFGTGKRVCLGQSLVRDTVFVYLTSLCQQFSFLPDPLNPIPCLEPKEFGFFRGPKDFKVVFHRRST